MKDTIRVAVDAMGGDNSPSEIVKGAVEAVLANDNVKVILVGKQEDISKELEKYEYSKEKIEIVHAHSRAKQISKAFENVPGSIKCSINVRYHHHHHLVD